MDNLHEMREALLEAGYTFDPINDRLCGVFSVDGELIQIYRDDDTEAVMTAYRRLEREYA